MPDLPAEMWIVGGVSVAFLGAAFFLGGFYEDLKWRRKQKRYGGYVR